MADETIRTDTTSPVTPINPAVSTAPAGGYGDTTASPHTEEAKSRFNAALDEAKAGAAALKDEAMTRATAYREQARDKSEHWTADARGKAGELATEGKGKASGALVGLSRLVDENAATLDENFGPRYGDYARNASRYLRESAETLERKSVEELGDDARTFVREQPATAVGLAALVGFVFARIFRK